MQHLDHQTFVSNFLQNPEGLEELYSSEDTIYIGLRPQKQREYHSLDGHLEDMAIFSRDDRICIQLGVVFDQSLEGIEKTKKFEETYSVTHTRFASGINSESYPFQERKPGIAYSVNLDDDHFLRRFTNSYTKMVLFLQEITE